ncbi:Hypothetical protein GLP15_1487 [Giardia lamblia P15]|uniref:Uncharacterized protein n=1 Tax=Giardia intestinalis (strain P15) TaxID=658858 RepID=E1EYQ1_GIAIA|nr:Hypothetical protein GLP15_1487 [Giardia lamblia P15]
MDTANKIKEILAQIGDQEHDSYAQLVGQNKILNDEEFYDLYSQQEKLMRFNPKLQTAALLEPVISFIPHKHVEFQEPNGFSIRRIHQDADSKPLEAVVSPAYKEMIFRLYPNIKALYDTVSKEGPNFESDFWLHVIFEFDDHAKSNYITEFKTSGPGGTRKTTIMPSISFLDDSSKTMTHLLNVIKRSFSNKHDRFRNLFDINNIHINLLNIVGNITLFGSHNFQEESTDMPPKDFRCKIDDLLYDTNSGSTADLLAVMDTNDKLQGNSALFQPHASYGIGDDIHNCYRNASNFVLIRSIQAYNILLMKDIGHGSLLNAHIIDYEKMANTCILDRVYSEPPLKQSMPLRNVNWPVKKFSNEGMSQEEIAKKNSSFKELFKARHAAAGIGGDTPSRKALMSCFSRQESGKEFPHQQVQSDTHESIHNTVSDTMQKQDAVYIKNFQWLYDFSRYTMTVLFSDKFQELRSNKLAFKQKLSRLYKQLDCLENNLTTYSTDSILFRFENRIKKILKLTEDALDVN